jgi:hypothetical protein
LKNRTRKAPKLADKLTKKVELKLAGETWPIVLNHNILIEAEELTGLNVLAGEVNLLKPSAKLVRALLYLSLKRAGADYTLAEVGELIHPANIAPVQEALLMAWAASMPEEETDSAETDPTPAASE